VPKAKNGLDVMFLSFEASHIAKLSFWSAARCCKLWNKKESMIQGGFGPGIVKAGRTYGFL
jgi:hypothetical protein